MCYILLIYVRTYIIRMYVHNTYVHTYIRTLYTVENFVRIFLLEGGSLSIIGVMIN